VFIGYSGPHCPLTVVVVWLHIYTSAHRQDDCRQNILAHLTTSGNHFVRRGQGENAEEAAMEADVEHEDCLHVTESLLLERSCSPLTSV
jgi:hypothetical protein